MYIIIRGRLNDGDISWEIRVKTTRTRQDIKGDKPYITKGRIKIECPFGCAFRKIFYLLIYEKQPVGNIYIFPIKSNTACGKDERKECKISLRNYMYM